MGVSGLRAELLGTRARRLTALLIAGNFAFFCALLGVMFYMRWVSEEWPTPFHFASLLMAVALTMFTICGSFTMTIASRAAKLEDTEPAVRWLAIAMASWFVFLFLEIVEWVRLIFIEKLGPDTSFGSTFLALTGAHYVAATGCLGWFAFAAADVKRRDMLAPALYSWFLTFWWVVLVFTLYFANADLQGI